MADVEVLVLKGSVTSQPDELVIGSWLRQLVGSRLELEAGDDGACFRMKTGHLREIEAQLARVARRVPGAGEDW